MFWLFSKCRLLSKFFLCNFRKNRATFIRTSGHTGDVPINFLCIYPPISLSVPMFSLVLWYRCMHICIFVSFYEYLVFFFNSDGMDMCPTVSTYISLFNYCFKIFSQSKFLHYLGHLCLLISVYIYICIVHVLYCCVCLMYLGRYMCLSFLWESQFLCTTLSSTSKFVFILFSSTLKVQLSGCSLPTVQTCIYFLALTFKSNLLNINP